MFITLKDIRGEIATLFKDYNFLKTCNADDEQARENIEKQKLLLLDKIKDKHDYIFKKLGLDDSMLNNDSL